MKNFLLFSFIIYASNLYSQVFETTVSTYFPGDNLSLESTPDSGYIMFCGSQYTSLLMVKFDPVGNVSWSKLYSEVGMDKAVALGKNHFAVYGNFTISYWPYQITSALHVIDTSGIIQYNYLLPESLTIKQMHPTRDGGTIAIADPNGGYPTQIFKTDSLGILQWAKSIDSIPPVVYSNYLTDITEAGSNGYVGIMNYHYPDTSGAPWYSLLVRLDSLGDTLWTKSFDLSGGWYFRIISASSNSYLIYQDNEIILVDSSGQIKWSKFSVDTISGIGFSITDCKLSNDGNFIFKAEYYDMAQNTSANCLMKIDTSGVVQWLRSYIVPSPSYYGIPLANTKDEGFAFISSDFSNQHCTLIKTDSLGVSSCDSSVATPVFADSIFVHATPLYYAIHTLNLQLTDTLGWPGSTSNSSFTQMNNCLLLRNKEIFTEENSIYISPNPTIGQFIISSEDFADKNSLIAIFNVVGEKKYEATVSSGSKSQTINCKLNAGIYFVKVSDGEKQAVKKLVVE